MSGGSSFSELKLLVDGVFDTAAIGPISINFNATGSFYHDPDSDQEQKTVRDYSAVLGIETAFDVSRAKVFSQAADLSMATVALTGRASYMEEIDDVIGNVQIRFEWPLASDTVIPISLNWINRTETRDDDEFKIAIGLSLDADKMTALAKFLGAMGG